jgi:hypothetical protein
VDLRYPAHRYHAVPSPGFEPMTLWLKVRHPNHAATTHQLEFVSVLGAQKVPCPPHNVPGWMAIGTYHRECLGKAVGIGTICIKSECGQARYVMNRAGLCVQELLVI